LKVNKENRKKYNMPENKGMSKFLYFSGMGFQMIAIIGLFAYIGYKIDESRGSDRPIFTALFSLLGVGLSLYSVIKSVLKSKDS
jgi:F0F1-type ATP synthase assembly protein I